MRPIPATMPAAIHRTSTGRIRSGPRSGPASTSRARRPAFATFVAGALVPFGRRGAEAPDPGDDAGGDPSHEYREDPERPPERPGFDLKRLAARHDTAYAMHWHALLARAVDAGQDRA